MRQTWLMVGFLVVIFITTLSCAPYQKQLNYATKKSNDRIQKQIDSFSIRQTIPARPPSAPIAFDCKAREFALEYAQVIQPWRSDFSYVYDALELTTRCNQTKPRFAPDPIPSFPIPADDAAVSVFYIDALKGSDSNPGTIAQPFQTIQRGVIAARSSMTNSNTLYLRNGTFYLQNTIKLGSEDSGLTISNYPNETVYISGGKPLVTTWKPYNVSSKRVLQIFSDADNVFGLVNSASNATNIRYLGTFTSLSDCVGACEKMTATSSQPCNSFTWKGASQSGWTNQCFAVIDQLWGPSSSLHVFSGRFVQPNIYVADLKGQIDPAFPAEGILGIQQVNGGKRASRARYPNGDTETTYYPQGWVQNTVNWLPPAQFPDSLSVLVAQPARNDCLMFQQYTIGLDGPCSIFSPPESYWCSQYCAGGGAGTFITPSGLQYFIDTFSFTNPINNNETGKYKYPVIQVWHPAHWASWMYQIDNINTNNQILSWTKGGFQGARGAVVGGGKGGQWYIENFLSQLDAPNEWYYDVQSQQLYYFYNNTGSSLPPPSDFQLIATRLKVLFEVSATQYEPIQNLTFQGLRFVATAYTYLDDHGVPSGGDWAMQYIAAITVSGSENLLIDSCKFDRLDGLAVILKSYNRNGRITHSDFSWIGDSVVVLWGETMDMDGTDGNQPRNITLDHNLFREFGIYEKQSSPWFQAKSCQNTITNNIMFNGPRALININDGFGGDNEVTRNLLFNANRETTDQGPFNSWDRMPFLTDVLYGKNKPSLTPKFNYIHHNFMICNYGSNMCIDNDDGSSYYYNYNNFNVYGGHKSDFGGHSKYTFNNLDAYAQDYEDGLCGDFSSVVPGYSDGYYNNTCVQGVMVPYLDLQECDSTNPDPDTLPILGFNRVHNAQASVSITCNQNVLSEAAWQKLGFDKGTVGLPMLTNEEIIDRGKKLLGVN